MSALVNAIQRSHWAIDLSGILSDLEVWASVLTNQGDPWIEKCFEGQDRYLLRSNSFNVSDTDEKIRGLAGEMLSSLNGAMQLYSGTRSTVTIAGVWDVRQDGKHGVSIFAEAAQFLASAHAPAPASIIGPTPPQKWTALASKNPVVAEMLKFCAGGANWYELYKAFECVRHLAGGQPALLRKSWAPTRDELSRFTWTANYYHRHATDPHEPAPPNPMNLAAATKLVRKMIDAMLAELI